MRVPEVGRGVTLGGGATNWRSAECDVQGNLDTPRIAPTPRLAAEFFGLNADRIYSAANNGAKWAVVGAPGLVWVEIDAEGVEHQMLSVTKIPALNRKEGFDMVDELVKAKPAIKDLLASDEFTLLVSNDGPLAALAAAKLFGAKYNVVGNVILGSGNGAGIARCDMLFFPGQNLFYPDPARNEIGHLFESFDDPASTPETNVSGTAIEEKEGKSAQEVDIRAPIYQLAMRTLAKQAVEQAFVGGAEIVVFSGGVAIDVFHTYEQEIQDHLDEVAGSPNPMAGVVPVVTAPPREMASTFELHGGYELRRSQLAFKAAAALVAAAN